MDLRFAHMHKQHSHSIIRSFESISPVSLVDFAHALHTGSTWKEAAAQSIEEVNDAIERYQAALLGHYLLNRDETAGLLKSFSL